MKTYFPKSNEIKRSWYIIDAQDKVLGDVATHVADLLRGKNKPVFSPHLDSGDFVVVINAQKVKVTGQKPVQKLYRSHSGYFGHLREISLKDMLEKKPEELLENAVAGMLPKNRMRKDFLKKLKIYAGSEHPHAAQQPQEFTF